MGGRKGGDGKELRAETTVVQTNWIIVAPFPHTCPGAD